MVGGAVDTQVDTERHTGPGGILCAAVEADLVRFFALELVEEGVGDGFGRQLHVEDEMVAIMERGGMEEAERSAS